MRQAPRVLFVTPALAQGGAERWILTLCRHFEQVQCAGILVTGDCYDADTVAEARKLGVPLIVPSERVDADVVVTWGVSDIRRHVGPIREPVVLVSHASPGFAEQTTALSQAAWQATHWTAVCEEARLAYPVAYQEQVKVLANGVDPHRVSWLAAQRADMRARLSLTEDTQKVVLWLGRIEEEKRPDLFIRATEHLSEDWLPVMLGDGSMRRQCIDAAKELGRRVVFAGYTPNVAPYYALADVVCLSSRCEAMPLTAVEAWMAGLPVASTANRFICDVRDVYGPHMAEVVSVGCTAEAMADAIVVASTRNGQYAAEIARHHWTARDMAYRWETYLIHEVLQRGD